MPATLNDVLADAVRAGLIDVVKQLLDEGANPKADQSLALRCAAENGHLAIVKLLLPVSDPKAQNSWALRAAAMNGHLEVVRLLLPVSAPRARRSLALRLAAKYGHLEIARLLLPVSDQKANGYSALQMAAKNGHLEIVKLLLPLSDIDVVMLNTDFIETSGCDLLLSNLPTPRARKLAKLYPQIPLPRTRAMLAAQSLYKRPTTISPAKRRRA